MRLELEQSDVEVIAGKVLSQHTAGIITDIRSAKP